MLIIIDTLIHIYDNRMHEKFELFVVRVGVECISFYLVCMHAITPFLCLHVLSKFVCVYVYILSI
jgi:hypothetical protein